MMYWFGRPRAGGKTTEMIKIASMYPGVYIVASCHREAYRVAEEARRMGLSIPFPLSYSEFIKGEFARTLTGVVIDNVDQLLQYMCRGVPLLAGSIDTSTCRGDFKFPVPLKYEVEDDDDSFQKEIEGSWRVRKDGD